MMNHNKLRMNVKDFSEQKQSNYLRQICCNPISHAILKRNINDDKTINMYNDCLSVLRYDAPSESLLF